VPRALRSAQGFAQCPGPYTVAVPRALHSCSAQGLTQLQCPGPYTVAVPRGLRKVITMLQNGLSVEIQLQPEDRFN
jgi:hypothetical protein